MKKWSEVNGIYQIYPRSFKDTDGDGVGDISGIVEKIDYLKGGASSLGIDAVWLSPFFPSPMKDFGYDVSNYCDVDPLFGSLEDIDALISEAHKRDLLVMIDFVPNHTSSEHPWFKEALKSKVSDKRRYYIFRDPLDDGSPPNNWLSVFGGSAWEYDKSSGQYYLHSFLKEQPDLDWSNPSVQAEMRDILRFWFDRGIDGIRADAIRWMGKNTNFIDDPINDAYREGQDPYHSVEHKYSRFSPELNEYLHVMTEVAREYENKIIIFEDHLDTLSPIESQVRRIYSIDPSVSAPFNFQAMHIDASARSFSAMITNYQDFLPENARAYYCFSNHDESRVATRFGGDMAPMMAVLQFTLPGTPVLYYGQELGMTDATIHFDEIRDPFELRVPGKGLGRDPQRTPMQWDASSNAGFTFSDKTWLPVEQNYAGNNVALQQSNPNSLFALHAALLRLRNKYPVLQTGTYEHVSTDESVFMYTLRSELESFVVAINFSENTTSREVVRGGMIVVSAQNPELVGGITLDVLELMSFEGIVIRYES